MSELRYAGKRRMTSLLQERVRYKVQTRTDLLKYLSGPHALAHSGR